MSWSETILAALKENDIRLVTYVPDNVLTPLIKGVAADNYFISVPATREDEAVGALTGAYMGGLRGVAMMQTSGFALIANALASLVVPYQIPAVLVISERGAMGEFNVGQVLIARTMRPTLEFARHSASHARRCRDAALHRQLVDQAGVHDAGAGRPHSFPAADRRQPRLVRPADMTRGTTA